MNRFDVNSLLTRYGILILVGIANVLFAEKSLFYQLFTPLTLHPVYWAVHALYDATFFPPNTFFFKGYYASIIPACVAGSAYYLLLILNMTTPMPLKKRLGSLVFLFTSFLILNIGRIVLFSSLLFKGYQYFDIAHLTTWYIGSTFLIIVIWFANVFLFRIKPVPVFDDIRQIRKDMYEGNYI